MNPLEAQVITQRTADIVLEVKEYPVSARALPSWAQPMAFHIAGEDGVLAGALEVDTDVEDACVDVEGRGADVEERLADVELAREDVDETGAETDEDEDET